MTSAAPMSDMYVAVRWPESHFLYHLMLDERDPAVVDRIRQSVLTSVREALDALGVHVIETSEEAI